MATDYRVKPACAEGQTVSDTTSPPWDTTRSIVCQSDALETEIQSIVFQSDALKTQIQSIAFQSDALSFGFQSIALKSDALNCRVPAIAVARHDPSRRFPGGSFFMFTTTLSCRISREHGPAAAAHVA